MMDRIIFYCRLQFKMFYARKKNQYVDIIINRSMQISSIFKAIIKGEQFVSMENSNYGLKQS